MSKFIVFVFLLSFVSGISAQDTVLKAETPILITSCGQSPGPMRIKVFLKILKIDYSYELQATTQTLITAKENGTPFKTLFIVTGASQKGMGAAGVSMKDELSRTKALIVEARRQGIKIIGSHLEGMARRSQGAAAGDNSDEQSIDAVMLSSDFMLISKDGDEDNRFTLISKNKNIPVVFYNKNMELKSNLKTIFE
ncbi:hypothetical protein KAR48_06625 [bacterium]|nr:hypothetical protein [bacterium]